MYETLRWLLNYHLVSDGSVETTVRHKEVSHGVVFRHRFPERCIVPAHACTSKASEDVIPGIGAEPLVLVPNGRPVGIAQAVHRPTYRLPDRPAAVVVGASPKAANVGKLAEAFHVEHEAVLANCGVSKAEGRVRAIPGERLMVLVHVIPVAIHEPVDSVDQVVHQSCGEAVFDLFEDLRPEESDQVVGSGSTFVQHQVGGVVEVGRVVGTKSVGILVTGSAGKLDITFRPGDRSVEAQSGGGINQVVSLLAENQKP